MKKSLLFSAMLLIAVSCLDLRDANPYSDTLYTVTFRMVMPEGYDSITPESVAVSVADEGSTAVYGTVSDSEGVAEILLPNGIYRMTVGAMLLGEQFNASSGGIVVDGAPVEVEVCLEHSITGDLVIKEIYCGGCMKYPEEGTYQSDSYIILHNNAAHTVYLDGLCFGSVDPYNSTATSVWDWDIDFVPVIQAVWQFPGSGTDWPLAPGEDAVLAIYGAIDHRATYPLSVNLNDPAYFVCYNPTYFYNTLYHPAPGDRIRADHWLDVVIKTGQANAYTFSITSPAVVIFRAEGCTIQEFVSSSVNVIQKPGSSVDKVVCVPYGWISDGVEVFNGQSSTNRKRLGATVDAGAVTLSNIHEGRTLMRRVDEEKSAAAGYEVLVDTNNSSNDFYEREIQSLND